MREIKSPKTNVEHMMNSMIRASQEDMTMVVNGDPNTKGFIVVHGGVGYVVSTNSNGEVAKCTCPHHFYRNVICKHMIKIALEHGLNVADLPEVGSKEVPVQENNTKITQLHG